MTEPTLVTSLRTTTDTHRWPRTPTDDHGRPPPRI